MTNQSSPRASAQVPNSAPPASADPNAFRREHEMCDAVLTLLVAHSRYATNADADRLGLIQHCWRTRLASAFITSTARTLRKRFAKRWHSRGQRRDQ